MAKELKPVLTGQRLKARKRDVKEKFNRDEFRDELMEGLIENESIDGATKFFENNAKKFDYRQYDDALFDIIIAGGILAPGGSIVNDGADLNPFSVFETDNEFEAQKGVAEMIRALVRRYKYLQVSLEDAFIKLLKFLAGYSAENLLKLAHNTAFLLSMNLISGKVLSSVTSIDNVVSAGQSKTFLTTLLQTWFSISTVQQIGTVLRKANLDQKIAEFFPINERGSESIIAHFKATSGLESMAGWYIGQLTAEVKSFLLRDVVKSLRNGETEKVLVDKVGAVMQTNKIPESEIVKLVWSGLMQSVEWSKKPDMATEQALRHVRDNLNFLGNFMKSDRAQVVLLITMQEHAFINQVFLKIFSRFCLMMYKADYLTEDAIVQWYMKDHSQKGKMAFLEEMKKFIDWFEKAEVEDE